MPRLGSSFDLSVDDSQVIAAFAILLAGDVTFQPSLSLASIGAPGCQAYTNVLASVAVPISFPAGRGIFTLPIPGNPLLVGAMFTSQYAAFTLQNALNLTTSNAAVWMIGN